MSTDYADLYRIALAWTGGDETRARAMVEAYLTGALQGEGQA